MAIDFPSSPTVGQKYTFAGVTYTYTAGGVWAGGTVAATTYTASATAPVLPNPGNFWYDLSTGVLSIYVDDGNSQQWVQVSPVPAQPPMTVTTADALAHNGLQVNGAMEISQENGTAAQTVSVKYIVDAWILNMSGVTASAAQVADAPAGFSNSVKITVSVADPALGASTFAGIFQRIEGYRTSRLAWGTASAQPITIGFWSKIHRPGTYSVSVRNNGSARSYATTFTHNVADAWEYKTLTIPGDTTGTWLKDNGIGISLSFVMASGSSLSTTPNVWTAGNFPAANGATNGVAATTDTFQITGVVVLPGIQVPTAAQSPFIMRQYDQEKSLCRRYYINETYGAGGLWLFAIDTGASFRRGYYRFDPEMRIPPVITVTGGSSVAFSAGNPSVSLITTLSCQLNGDLTTVGGYCYISTLIADARL